MSIGNVSLCLSGPVCLVCLVSLMIDNPRVSRGVFAIYLSFSTRIRSRDGSLCEFGRGAEEAVEGLV